MNTWKTNQKFLDSQGYWKQHPDVARVVGLRGNETRRKLLKDGKKSDAWITKSFIEDGWIVLRFWEHEIVNNLKGCSNRIEEVMS